MGTNTTKSNTDHEPVTVIGLGLMGQALAAAFLKEGHPTTVWNRSPGKADQLVAEGATLADSVVNAVAASPLVIVCVSNYEAVHELLDPLDDVLADQVLVNLTSSSSVQAREAAEWATSRGITYLDGAIMALPPAIGTDEAVILYSGPQSAFDEHERALRGLSPVGTTYLGDDHGLSSLYDVAVLGMMWSILNAFYHGSALLGAAGVQATRFAGMAKPLVETIAGWLPEEAQLIDDGTHLDPALDSTIDTSLAAMEHLIHESESLGVNSELPRFIKALTNRAVADGHADSSYAAMIEQFRKPSMGTNAQKNLESAATAEAVEHYTADNVSAWYQARGVKMAIGDVLDASNSESMSVGFARWAAGAENVWTLTYDETLVITKGVLSVVSGEGMRTAKAGEVIFLRRGTKVVYRAEEDVEVVYVTYPNWLEATEQSELATQLDDYDEVSAAEAAQIREGSA